MKRAVYALAAVVLFFGMAEIVLRLVDYRGAPAVEDFRFRVIGELFGEPDPVRFWRLPGVEPHFTEEGYRIICLADSVTVMDQGKGWPDLLPGMLAEAGVTEKIQVFNAGVPGYTSYQGLLYLRQELASWKPDLVTIQFGWNDHWESPSGVPDKLIRLPDARTMARQKTLAQIRLYRLLRTLIIGRSAPNGTLRVDPRDYEANLKAMIDLAASQGARTLLITAPYLDGPWEWADRHREYNELTRRTAREMKVTLIDAVPEFRERPELFAREPEADACHFNAEGATIIARAVAKTMREQGWVR